MARTRWFLLALLVVVVATAAVLAPSARRGDSGAAAFASAAVAGDGSRAARTSVATASTGRHAPDESPARGLAVPFPVVAEEASPALAERRELGRLLFFDPILSAENNLSCAHCHHPDLGFADGRARALGRGGAGLGPARTGGVPLRRGAPSLWNAAFAPALFWDGRAATLEEQAAGPITAPDEMGEDPERLTAELAAIPEYARRFRAAFPPPAPAAEAQAPVSFQHVTAALAAFERTLLARDSRFDRFAAGDRAALDESEKSGLKLFLSPMTRCVECHELPTFTSRQFKVIGVPDAPDAPPDAGRAEVVGGRYYRGAFKTPTLRNVALTAPYMHNGAFATLEEVVDFYASGKGRERIPQGLYVDDFIGAFQLSAAGRRDLVAFLRALTDERPPQPPPAAVPSGLAVVPRLNRNPAPPPGAAHRSQE
ncbi:MAG: cytochrome-c peroxidase [Planctomycetes bacterium]|nr:cytochrome-c peroxidase [Planctomycetota bacterium]